MQQLVSLHIYSTNGEVKGKEQIQKIAFEETEKYKSKVQCRSCKELPMATFVQGDIKNIAEQQDSNS